MRLRWLWTYFGIHGMDTNDPAAPQIVHAHPLPYPNQNTSLLRRRRALGDDVIRDGRADAPGAQPGKEALV